MRRATIFIASMLACAAAAAQTVVPGQPISGNQFDLLFQDPHTRIEALMIGVHSLDGSAAIGTLICFPAGFTYVQGAKVIGKYMDDNPQNLNLKMHDLIILALSRAFPCQ